RATGWRSTAAATRVCPPQAAPACSPTRPPHDTAVGRPGGGAGRCRSNRTNPRRFGPIVFAGTATIAGAMDDDFRKAALDYHRHPRPGKLSVEATKRMETQRDLALAYSPGVAAACEAIVADPHSA